MQSFQRCQKLLLDAVVVAVLVLAAVVMTVVAMGTVGTTVVATPMGKQAGTLLATGGQCV